MTNTDLQKIHPKWVLKLFVLDKKPENSLLSLSSSDRTRLKTGSLQSRLIIPPPIENLISEMIILNIHLLYFTCQYFWVLSTLSLILLPQPTFFCSTKLAYPKMCGRFPPRTPPTFAQNTPSEAPHFAGQAKAEH